MFPGSPLQAIVDTKAQGKPGSLESLMGFGGGPDKAFQNFIKPKPRASYETLLGGQSQTWGGSNVFR